MTNFKFTGDWNFKLQLNEFSKIYQTTDQTKDWNNFKLDRMQGIVSIKIIDFKSYDPDPLPEQLKALNYLIDHQTKVISAILSAIKTINIHYVEEQGPDHWSPKPLTIASLGELLEISEVIILTEHKDGYAYFQFDCSYAGDQEHGLSMIMHKERLIEYAQQTELEHRKLYTDLGAEAQNFINTNIAKQQFGENLAHKVIPKYNKFKPWQLEASSEHLSNLFKRKENEKLKELIENDEWDIHLRFGDDDMNLIDFATRYQNMEMVEYLLEKEVDFSRSILYSLGGQDRQEIATVLIKKGASIDTLQVNGKTPLGNEVLNFGFAMQRFNLVYDKDSDQYKYALKALNQSKDRIAFYLKMGANPANCDGKGGDFKSMIGGRWSTQKDLIEKIFGTLEELISNH